MNLDVSKFGFEDIVKTEEQKQNELAQFHFDYQTFINSKEGQKITIYEKKLLQRHYSLGNREFLQKVYFKSERDRKVRDTRMLEFTTTTEEMP